MKLQLTLIASLLFSGAVFATTNCTTCHNPIDESSHVANSAFLGNCNECHMMSDAHTIDMDKHDTEAGVPECKECHKMD